MGGVRDDVLKFDRTRMPSQDGAMPRRIGLVGCVKQKRSVPSPARDLYVSNLFLGRRAYVECSCDTWWVLSAAHGLVHPGQVLEPYDVTLKNASRAERRRWSEQVLRALDEEAGIGPDDVVEIHAGAEYRDFGLTAGLRLRGAEVVIPTEGMPIGKQLQFYKGGCSLDDE